MEHIIEIYTIAENASCADDIDLIKRRMTCDIDEKCASVKYLHFQSSNKFLSIRPWRFYALSNVDQVLALFINIEDGFG